MPHTVTFSQLLTTAILNSSGLNENAPQLDDWCAIWLTSCNMDHKFTTFVLQRLSLSLTSDRLVGGVLHCDYLLWEDLTLLWIPRGLVACPHTVCRRVCLNVSVSSLSRLHPSLNPRY